MNSEELEHKFISHKIEESMDFHDWWTKVESLRHLDSVTNIPKRRKT